MAHYCLLRNGMTNATEVDLSNIAVAYIQPTGGGVVGTNDYQISAQLTPNNTVKVNTGRAYVQNSALTMVYATLLDATQNVTIGANSSGNSRIDSIVLYIDLSASPDANADNVAKFFDVQGSPSPSPTSPTGAQILAAIGSSNPYIVLCNVTVANGFTSINSGNLSDQRQTAYLSSGPVVPVTQYAKFTDQSSNPSTPTSGITDLYTKSKGVFVKDSSGGIAQIGSNTVVSNGNTGTNPAVDWSNGINQLWTVSAACTFTFANPVAGEKLVLVLSYSGSFTPVLPTVKWSQGVAPTFTATSGKKDIIGFFWDGTDYLGVYSLNY